MSAMHVGDLARAIPGARVLSGSDPEITGICYDSRKAKPGSLFVALREAGSDGHDFAADAVSRGACALLVERLPGLPAEGGPSIILVPDTWSAFGPAAAQFYDHPSRDLTVYAVTGTNGKTSTTYLIHSICEAAGVRSGIVGTLGAVIDGQTVPLPHTTPYAGELQAILARMRDAGVKSVAMEASSHALAQRRIDALRVNVAVFTNLTQDHLDFHGSMDEYFRVKADLFTRFADESGKRFCSVVNLDDPVGRERLRPIARGEVVAYGTAPDADVHASRLRFGTKGTCFQLDSPWGRAKVQLRIGGLFNVHNALAAASACLATGISLDVVGEGLERTGSVPGRFELVDRGQPFAVVVDYAHTPDGLENVLSSARSLTKGRLIAVFGCGGDRDRSKRPLMGEIASRLADVCILTSDNPRSEAPAQIASDAMEGVCAADREKVIVDLDRRSAIHKACRLANEGDVVVVAGKGHETYQIFADKTIHFDDREVVAEALDDMHAAGREAAS